MSPCPSYWLSRSNKAQWLVFRLHRGTAYNRGVVCVADIIDCKNTLVHFLREWRLRSETRLLNVYRSSERARGECHLIFYRVFLNNLQARGSRHTSSAALARRHGPSRLHGALFGGIVLSSSDARFALRIGRYGSWTLLSATGLWSTIWTSSDA